MPLFNHLVRLYLFNYRKKLESLRCNALDFQKNQLNRILSSAPLWSGIVVSKNEFYKLPPTEYRDYKTIIDVRINSTFDDNPLHFIRYFMKSAGTSGESSKYIPTSVDYLRENHLEASWLTLFMLYSLKPDMDIFRGKNLLVGGAVYRDDPDTVIADVSSIMIRNIPRIFHRFHVPLISDAIDPDWERKLEIITRAASGTSDVVMFGGVPTWLITVFRDILDRTGKANLLELWPNLKAFLHGGVRFEPYKSLFKELIPTEEFQYLEVYNASEGFIAAQDTKENQGMLLMTDHGIYFEFIERYKYQSGDYEIISLTKVELGTDYVLLITNLSGLYRYIIGDVVSFTSINPYRIMVKGRTEDFINAFGEDLTVSTLDKALSMTLKKHNAHIKEYTVAPVYLSKREKGKHQWFIEFEKEPIDLFQFSVDLDNCISILNFNYRQKRTKDLALNMLDIQSMPHGFFDAYAKSKGRFGGQNKLLKVRNDRILAEDITRFFNEEYTAELSHE